MNQNRKNANSPLFVDTEFVPAQMQYFTVFDMQVSPVPNVLPYSQDHTTSKDLQEKMSNIGGINSSISSQHSSMKDMSIKDIKKKACKKKMNGDEIFIDSKSNLIDFDKLINTKEKQRQEQERCQICCIILPDLTNVVHLSIDWKSQHTSIKALVQEINLMYGLKLSVNNVKLNELAFELQLDKQEVFHIILKPIPIKKLTESIFNSDKIAYIGVQICNQFKIEKDPEVISDTSLRKLIKFQVNEKKSFKFQIEKIKSFKISEILGIIGVENPESKGAWIIDKFYEPSQLLESLKAEYKEGAFINLITAEVASQGETFYDMIDKNPILSQPELDKLMYSNSPKNYDLEDKETKNTALSLFNSDFRLVHTKSSQSFSFFYHKINKYIRNSFTHFLSVFDSSTSSRFVRNLKDQILRMDAYEGPCFRKVCYELNCKIGDVLTFKNFIIATTEHTKIKDNNAILYQTKKTMIKIHSSTGRKMGKQSFFEELDEVIFLPFTKFQVVNRIQNENTIFLNLDEIVDNPKRNLVNIILWVDDKKQQGINICRKLEQTQQSFYLYQIDSTSLLQKWIKTNRALITSKKAQFIVITNMKRKQDDKIDEIAGIKAIILTLNNISEAKIIVYIGNIQNTINHLQKNQIDLNKVTVTRSRSELYKILTKNICGEEKQYGKQVQKKGVALNEGMKKGNQENKNIEIAFAKKPPKLQKPPQPKQQSSIILPQDDNNFDEYQLQINSYVKTSNSKTKYIL